VEKRHSNRIVIGLKAEIISDDIHYEGVIENLSEDGICVITVPTENTIDFAPGAILQIKFQFLSEETLNLRCKVKWSCKTPPHGLTQKIGMEIIDPPWDKSD
jgi:hypothetical protein